jgi:hypothetical protein
VIVSNTTAGIVSSNAVLMVDDPAITSLPASRTNDAGTTATFTVGATGSGTLSYHWFKNSASMNNGGKISGVTTATLKITNVLGADAAGYTVVVTNSVGSVTSAPPAFLIVNDPLLTGQPASRTNNAGDTTTFTASAIGTATLNYFWFRNGVLLNNGGKISGATTAALTITNVLGGDGGNYTVVVSNSFGTVTNSPPALLAVVDPIITSQPASRTNHLGTTASFTVGAYGTAPAYQWLKGGAPIIGATNATFSIASVTTNDAAGYSAVVSNAFGNPLSSPAMLTVVAPPMFLSVTVTNSTASLTWSSIAGQSYRVLYKDDLTATNWNAVSPDVFASGPTATATNNISGSTNRFYRVLVLP